MKKVSTEKIAELLRPVVSLLNDMKEIADSEYGDEIQKEASEVAELLAHYGFIPPNRTKTATQDFVYKPSTSLQVIKKLATKNHEKLAAKNHELRSKEATELGESKEASCSSRKKSDEIWWNRLDNGLV